VRTTSPAAPSPRPVKERTMDRFPSQYIAGQLSIPDTDPQETGEWLDALEAVMEREGPPRAHYLLERLIDQARRNGTHLPYSPNTAYLNTIPPGAEERSPGNQELEARIRSLVRWNAVMQVLRAGRKD